MTIEQLREILAAHSVWVRGEGGTRANLRDADLRDADLSGADLSGAYLTRANLRVADLSGACLTGADLTGACFSGAKGLARASVSWHGHGIAGRELLCVKINGGLHYFCGCFRGTGDDLQAFIDADAVDERTTQTRRKALWIVSDLITDSPWEVEP